MLSMAAGAFFASAILGAALARVLARLYGNWVKYANAFCGGVLLSVALVHMLSENAAELEDFGKALSRALGGDSDEAFPIGYFLSGTGFLAIVSIDRLLVGHEAENPSSQDVVKGSGSVEERVVAQEVRAEMEPQQPSQQNDEDDDEIKAAARPAAAVRDCKLSDTIDLEANRQEGKLPPHADAGAEVQQAQQLQPYEQEQSLETSDTNSVAVKVRKGRLFGVATWFGITIHSSIEAVVTGGSRDDSSLLMLMLVVLTHKVLTSFAIAVALRDVNKKVWLTLIITFALTGPIGILFGATYVSNLEGEQSAALQCLASGTLLAIGIDSMLLPSLKDKSCGAFTCAVVAFCAMSTLAAWA